jgi:hypothetical protein
MDWTPEAVKAQMDYRLETARRHNAGRVLRESRSHHPAPGVAGPGGWWAGWASWWRLRTQHTTT